MISRNLLSSTISKYHLNGLVEKVVWKVNNNILHIAFRNEVGNLTGEIFVPCKIEKGEFNINDTSRLNKLLNILEGTILIDIIKNASDIPTLFKIADSKMDVDYNLAASEVLQGYWFDSSQLKDSLPEYDVEAELNEEDLRLFLKSVGALGTEVEEFNISTREEINGEEIEFSLGTNYSNRVSFGVSCKVKNPIVNPIRYDIISFKEILQSNKSFKTGKIYFSNTGISKAEFIEEIGEDEEIEVTYYIANKN